MRLDVFSGTTNDADYLNIMENDKEISELKSFGALAQYLPKLAYEIFRSELCIIQFLRRIIQNFKRFTIKSRKKHRKTVFDILETINLGTNEIEKIIFHFFLNSNVNKPSG